MNLFENNPDFFKIVIHNKLVFRTEISPKSLPSERNTPSHNIPAPLVCNTYLTTYKRFPPPLVYCIIIHISARVAVN